MWRPWVASLRCGLSLSCSWRTFSRVVLKMLSNVRSLHACRSVSTHRRHEVAQRRLGLTSQLLLTTLPGRSCVSGRVPECALSGKAAARNDANDAVGKSQLSSALTNAAAVLARITLDLSSMGSCGRSPSTQADSDDKAMGAGVDHLFYLMDVALGTKGSDQLTKLLKLRWGLGRDHMGFGYQWRQRQQRIHACEIRSRRRQSGEEKCCGVAPVPLWTTWPES